MKVIDVLVKLSQVERNRLKKFIESPYFNKNSELLKIYHSFDQHLRAGTPIIKEDVWSEVFPKIAYDDMRWRKFLTLLFDLIEKFIAIEHLLEDQTNLSNLSLERSIQNDIPELEDYSQRRVEKYLAKEPINAMDTHLKQIAYIRNRINKISEFEHKQKADKSESLRRDLISLDATLDRMYLQEKLRLACSFDNFNLGYNYSINDKITFESEILQMADTLDPAEHKGADMLKKILHSYRHSYDKNFLEKLFEELQAHNDTLSVKEAKDIYISLINQIIRKINVGIDDYNRTLINLFQYGIKSKLLYENGFLTPTQYRTFVITATKLEEYDLALQFIEENRHALDRKYQDTAYSFNKARVLTNMGLYDDVIEVLRDVEYEDLTYNLNSKLLLMVAYYELDEHFVLDSFIKSFKVFLRRRRNIPKSRKDAFYGFSNVLYNIIRAESNRDPKRVKIAREELNRIKTIPNRDWLLQKIEGLEKTLKITSV